MSGVLVMAIHGRLYLRVGRWQVEAGKPWLPFSVRVMGRPDTRPGRRLLGGWLVVAHLPRPERKDRP